MIKPLGVGAPIAVALVVLAVAVTRRGPHTVGARPAADFVVDSSRDAGPDSLREAILAADRLSSRARIVVTVRRITIDSALPALVNPHGVDIDAAAGFGVIDAANQRGGAALQINSATSSLNGLSILNAHVAAVVVDAPGVQLSALTVTGSSVGVLVHPAARGCIVRTSTFQDDDTAVFIEPGSRDVEILSSIFRHNVRAGLWFVGGPGSDGGRSSSATPASARYALRVIDSVLDANPFGMVVANQSALVQRDRFLRNTSALWVQGGTIRLQDSEFRSSRGTAASVASAGQVALIHNTFVDNPLTAIMVRDSDAVIDGNTLTHNGLGIVAISGPGSPPIRIGDNLISQSIADAITVIGGASILRHNRAIDNRGAGLRTLDLIEGHARLRATPQLDANVIHGNAIDMPPRGVYRLTGAP